MSTITFYRHSPLAAKMGVDAATIALHGFWWLRVARGQERGPDWADAKQASWRAKAVLKLAKWCQRNTTRKAGGAR